MTQGGKREGSGRDKLYGENETTKRIMISIPASKEVEVKGKIKKLLKAYIPKKG